MAEQCQALIPVAEPAGGLGLVQCMLPAAAAALWTCCRGHSRERLACRQHMRLATSAEVGCVQCLLAGIDGVPCTFTGYVELLGRS